jgi:hypothetical protein
MSNPDKGLPDTSFWRRSVAATALENNDPFVNVPFRLSKAL